MTSRTQITLYFSMALATDFASKTGSVPYWTAALACALFIAMAGMQIGKNLRR